VNELVEWLREQVDEDERAAQGCIDEVGPERKDDPFTDGSGPADRDSFPSYPWGSQERELEYMAGPGHPARVLAEVAAKRRIIDLHEPYDSEERGGLACWVCGPGGFPWPCETLRLLASVYAARPGWREEWAADEEVQRG
jgi:hypothetical protein